MSLEERNVAVHKDVQFDGIMVADASRPQVVRFLNALDGACQLQYLLLHIFRKGLFGKVSEAATQQSDGHFHNEETHDD